MAFLTMSLIHFSALERLYPRSSHVHRPDIQTGLVKVHLKQQSAINEDEVLAVIGIERSWFFLLCENEYNLGLTEQNLKL